MLFVIPKFLKFWERESRVHPIFSCFLVFVWRPQNIQNLAIVIIYPVWKGSIWSTLNLLLGRFVVWESFRVSECMCMNDWCRCCDEMITSRDLTFRASATAGYEVLSRARNHFLSSAYNSWLWSDFVQVVTFWASVMTPGYEVTLNKLWPSGLQWWLLAMKWLGNHWL
jgi:hypothetical protein